MADYPGSLYTPTVVTDNVTSVLAAHHNDLDDEVLAIETELGTDVAGSKTDLKTRLAVTIADDGTQEYADSTVLTISSGAITVTQNWHRVATEGGAGTDNLDTINGLGNDGAWLILRPSTSNDIVLKDGTGNIECISGSDITLDDTDEWAILIYDGNLSKWLAACPRASDSDVTTSSGAADSYIAVYTAAANIEGTDDLQWNGTTLTIGDGTAGRDYIITINGETNDISATWMEDEAYLSWNNNQLMASGKKIYFRDTALYVGDGGDGSLYLAGDVNIWLDTPLLYVGNGDDGVDYQLMFNGYDNIGVLTWMEDEDYLRIEDDILMQTSESVYFRDTAIHISSADDGHLDIVADTSVDIAAVTNIGDGGATNYATFAADGELTLVGTARVTKELQIEASNIAVGASGVVLNTDYLPYIGYDFGIGDNMYAQFEVPHDWDSSANLSVKLYWAINEAYVTNSGEVQWAIDWKACPTDASEAIDAPTHTGTIDFGDQDIPATAKYLTATPAGTISAASLSDGDLIGFDINRVALDDGSDPTDEPILYRVEIEYTSNKLGEAT